MSWLDRANAAAYGPHPGSARGFTRLWVIGFVIGGLGYLAGAAAVGRPRLFAVVLFAVFFATVSAAAQTYRARRDRIH